MLPNSRLLFQFSIFGNFYDYFVSILFGNFYDYFVSNFLYIFMIIFYPILFMKICKNWHIWKWNG